MRSDRAGQAPELGRSLSDLPRAPRLPGRLTALALGLTVPAVGMALALAPAAHAAGSAPALTQAQLALQTRLASISGAVDGLAPTAAGYDPAAAHTSLYNLESALGVRAQWSSGDTGAGVGVAVVDSGVASVAGLTGVVDAVDLSSTAGTSAAGSDGFGHGTHIASIIAGHDGSATGAALASSPPSSFEGIAPDARIYDIKVAEASGWTDPSRVIAGIAWAIQHRAADNIRVLNLSYGTDSSQSYRTDPVAYAVEQAWKAGIVVVSSAGNDGTLDGRLTDPAADPYGIAVAASGDATPGSGIALFSQQGDGTRNPDLAAPGFQVQGLVAPGSTLARLYPAMGTSARFLLGSGTSQSAAVVSGLAALLIQRQPTLTPDQVKATLVKTSLSMPGMATSLAGAGIPQIAVAVLVPVAASAAAQSFPLGTGSGTLDASRGSGSWIAAGATAAQANDAALGGNGRTGLAWADAAWAARSWSGMTWATSTGATALAGRSWAGRSWA